MKKLKFRGWHIAHKKMFSAEEMAIDQLTLLTTGEFINVNGTSTKLSTIFPRDKFIPLQYVGCKDKFGKEVYEGDIVVLSIHGGKKVVTWYEPYASYRLSQISIVNEEFDKTYPMNFIERSEIIGNIYENPELLKEAE